MVQAGSCLCLGIFYCMRIFLLGHRGFIGGSLLSRLESFGHVVIHDMKYLDDKYDCVINMAAVTHIKNEFDPKLIESNIILMNDVFKKTEKIIYASSCSAAHFTNPYAWSKMWAEHLGAKHGNALGLRFHNVFGPGNNKGIVWWLTQQPDGAEITIRGASVIRDYIYVDCVVDEIISHLGGLRYTGVLDVGTGVGTKTIDVVKLYMKLSGKIFVIDGVPHNSTEPMEMVSNNVVSHISLEQGLLKMINDVSNKK